MDVRSQLLTLLPETDVLRDWVSMQRGATDRSQDAARGARRAFDPPPRDTVLSAGMRAVEKMRDFGPDTALQPDEENGLEALVVLVGRPAIRIEDGALAAPMPPGWEVLEAHREAIQRTCRSVGRIDLLGHPMYPWAGTGFLVAPDVVMTNRHVAEAFTHRAGNDEWVFEPGVQASIDSAEAPDHDPPIAARITGVIGMHATHDLALLAIQPTLEAEPLGIAQRAPEDAGQFVYAVGYPAQDYRNDPAVMQQIFGDVYGVKRVQPGRMGAFLPEEKLLRHDCSTLGGNSGSCLVDLETGLVIGLHFRGFYMKYNEAVALSLLEDDPLLRSAGVRFVSSPGDRPPSLRPPGRLSPV